MTIQPALFANRSEKPNDSIPNSQQMPQWLLRRLDENGVIDLASGATRKARPAKCDKCRAWVIRGLDNDWCARAVDCDPEPLSAEGEALAKLSGIATYMLDFCGRPELNQRDSSRIRGNPAGQGRYDVLAIHNCRRPPISLPHIPSRLPEPVSTAELPDKPPF